MEPLNKVEMRGRVGSYAITMMDDGHWEGWFDLHVATKNMHGVYQPMVFYCHVAEDGKKVKGLGAGIGGKIVLITGRLVQRPEVVNRTDCYFIRVTSLEVVGGPQEDLKIREEE